MTSVEIRQIAPWPSSRYGPARYAQIESGVDDWPYVTGRPQDVAGMQIEPNEKQDIDFDFFVDSSVQSVLIRSRVENPMSKPLGWEVTTIYDMPIEKATEAASNGPEK